MSKFSPSRIRDKERVIVNCSTCGREFTVSCAQIKRRGPGYKFRCRRCVMNGLSEEDKLQRSQKIKDRLSAKTEDEKREMTRKRLETISNPILHKQISYAKRAAWKKKPDEELERISDRASNNMTAYWDNVDAVEKERRIKLWADGFKEWYNNLTEDELSLISERASARNKRRWESMTNEEKANFAQSKRDWWASLSEEAKLSYSKRGKNLSDHQKTWWNNMAPNLRQLQLRKMISGSCGHNKLHQRFESMFDKSSLNNHFYHVSEFPTSNSVMHCWDYALFDENGELQMLIDLDGAYYHADICDYDGMHSKLEYDERRGLSIPDGVKWCIINEKNFDKCFAYMEKCIVLTYDEFIEQRYREYRLSPFPEPEYSSAKLLKSYDLLQRMNCSDKYHQNMNLNTRNGDRIIQHFHHSLYDAQREAWRDDEALRALIRERAMYQCYLNKNKILQGLNVSQIVPNVRYMSAGKAKMIIDKYLSKYDTIFDPNMEWGGRMLGTIALGKHYVGLDNNDQRLRETMIILGFLQNHDIDFHVTLNADGNEYPCLFTECAENDIEQYTTRYKCNLYIFAVGDDAIVKEG